MTRVTNDLQSLIMQVRMMPVDAVFMRFPRMVRDLANTLGKRVDLVISGEDTELDRTVIDGLGDPLVHMLRNAVDHGLEAPERPRRRRQGPGRASSSLSARHAGSSVVIEVRDDGRGMDPAALRASVGPQGPDGRRPPPPPCPTRRPSSSSSSPASRPSRQTTDVSGRGVGMDAVRTAITDLSGEVTIQSVVGEGSSFTIRLPLTLAIIQALLVSAGSDPAASPIRSGRCRSRRSRRR